ncbi:MAG TPA: hypothetical protein VMT20_18380 [Terriglobia bacterium]|nr:hypothetical protein [Terriglobia bacterium]
MLRLRLATNLGLVLFTLLPFVGISHDLPRSQTFPLVDTKGLTERNVGLEVVEYKGRKAVRLTKEPPGDGLALLAATDFRDGTIEADLAMKPTTPPGFRNPGFIGIAFRARPDGSRYELFYLRPGNSQAADQAMRNHSLQYSSEPDFNWYRLRREWPWIYEAYADLQPEVWTHLKIEVAGRSAKLYLNGSERPSLVVDGLKGEDLHGAVGLWGYAGEECYFSNLSITPSEVQPVKNGTDPSGVWDVTFAADTGPKTGGPLTGSLKLSRNGDKLSGVWSGALGDNQLVAGTWRDGYVELTFPGTWPDEMREGAPGPVNARLAGWFDGASAKGRMTVEGRADGPWMATRRQ